MLFNPFKNSNLKIFSASDKPALNKRDTFFQWGLLIIENAQVAQQMY